MNVRIDPSADNLYLYWRLDGKNQCVYTFIKQEGNYSDHPQPQRGLSRYRTLFTGWRSYERWIQSGESFGSAFIH